jgi:hypothetical protein
MLVAAELLWVLRVLRLSPSTMVALAERLVQVNFTSARARPTLAVPNAGPIFCLARLSPHPGGCRNRAIARAILKAARRYPVNPKLPLSISQLQATVSGNWALFAVSRLGSSRPMFLCLGSAILAQALEAGASGYDAPSEELVEAVRRISTSPPSLNADGAPRLACD